MPKLHSILLCGLCLLSVSMIKANDGSAGNIWYEFTGDSLNPYRYKVYVQVYVNIVGSPSGGVGSHTVCVTSSCFPTSTHTANFVPVYNNSNPIDTLPGGMVGSILTPLLTECVDSNSANLAFSEIALYSVEITLPGKCSDFRFSAATCCRRNYDNVIGAQNTNMYLYATLNNLNGPNNSPRFVTPAAKSFCLNHSFHWDHTALEPDGDSLFYEIATSKTGSAGSCGFNTLSYATGYSLNQPMRTTNGLHLQAANGALSFVPSQLEVVIFNIKVYEYRLLNGFWALISTSERAAQASIVSDCKKSLINGPQFAAATYPSLLLGRDSVLGYGIRRVYSPDTIPHPNVPGKHLLRVPALSYNCFDSTITVRFKNGVRCNSIADDGSDFRLTGPDSVARPVVGVDRWCTPLSSYTDSIKLKLHKPLDENGYYYLQVKIGTDGTTLISRCGFETVSSTTAVVTVLDCPNLQYELLNVTVEEDKQIRIDWEADSMAYDQTFFNAWEIYRRNGGGTFYRIDEEEIHQARSYIDSSLGPEPLDMSSYDYRVRLRQNHDSKKFTRTIHSILLQANQADSTRLQDVDFNWNDYNGWSSPEYEFLVAKVGPPWASLDWKVLEGPKPNFNTYSHSFQEPNEGSSHSFVAKVIAYNPLDSNDSFVSESNWVFIGLERDFPPAAPAITYVIPTVFTPNGDGQNDLFQIESEHQQISISVFNRWGKLVMSQNTDLNSFEWDGRDAQSGQIVADGVYYYVIEFTSLVDDGQGGKREVKASEASQLHIFSGPR